MNNLKKLSQEIYIFALFVLIRLYGLGYEMFNTDVWKWKQRIYDFGTGVFTLDFAKTIQMYHPGVPLMWIGSIAIKFFNLTYRLFTGENPPDNNIEVLFQLHFTQKLFIVIALGVLVAIAFYLLKKLFDLKYAIIVVSILSLEPLYYALSREIHLEGLQTTFMLLAFLALYFFINNKSLKRWLYYSAIFASLAVLTKTAAVFLVPFSGLLLFINEYVKTQSMKDSIKRSLSLFGIWLTTFIVAFILIWPGMWVAPLNALNELRNGVLDIGVEGGHIQLFKGQWVEDPGFGFYLYAFSYRTSIYLFLGLLGFIFIYKRLKPAQKAFSNYVLLFSLLYFIEISIPSKKLDRYVLPLIVMLILIVGLFYERLTSFIMEKTKIKFFTLWGLFLLLPVLTLGILKLDFFSYYNPLFGGLRNGMWVLEPKWVIGQHVLMDYLEEKINSEGFSKFESGESLKNVDNLEDRLVVAFPEKYYTQLHPFVRRIGAWATIVSIKPDAKNAEYIIFPVWFDETQEDDPWKFYEQVSLRGVPIYNVYKNTNRFKW